jgi:AMMECR1 domain-containing protein
MSRPCSVVQRTGTELRRLIWQASLQPGCRSEDDCRMQRYHENAEQEGSALQPIACLLVIDTPQVTVGKWT